MKLYHMIGGINGVGKSSFLGVLKGNRSDLGASLMRIQCLPIRRL